VNRIYYGLIGPEGGGVQLGEVIASYVQITFQLEATAGSHGIIIPFCLANLF
jgi:hypothetical protein